MKIRWRPATSTTHLSRPSSEGLFYEQVTELERLTSRQILKTECHSTRLNTIQFKPIASIVPQLNIPPQKLRLQHNQT